MKEKTPVCYINIGGVDYEVLDVRSGYFYRLPEITVSDGSSFVVGTEDMFRMSVSEYYDNMDEDDLVDAIGIEEIVYNWKVDRAFSYWLSEIEDGYADVVPSWDGVELFIGELSDNFMENTIGISREVIEGGEWDYCDQLYSALGFTPEIAFLTSEAR